MRHVPYRSLRHARSNAVLHLPRVRDHRRGGFQDFSVEGQLVPGEKLAMTPFELPGDKIPTQRPVLCFHGGEVPLAVAPAQRRHLVEIAKIEVVQHDHSRILPEQVEHVAMLGVVADMIDLQGRFERGPVLVEFRSEQDARAWIIWNGGVVGDHQRDIEFLEVKRHQFEHVVGNAVFGRRIGRENHELPLGCMRGVLHGRPCSEGCRGIAPDREDGLRPTSAVISDHNPRNEASCVFRYR